MIRAYHQPETLDEALALVAGGALPIAGATGLYAGRARRDAELVDITRLGLDGIAVEEGQIVLGATVTLARLGEARELPGHEGALLRQVARGVASRPLRNAITLGGNLAHACYWADMPIPLLALDARLEIARPGQPTVEVPVADAVCGARPWVDGLIVRILVPRRAGTWAFGQERLSRTRGDYPLASVCTVARRDGETLRDVRFIVGALQARAVRMIEVEGLLEGRRPTDEVIAEAVERLRATAAVGPNYRASVDFRRKLVGVLARRALETVRLWATREG